MVQAWPFEQLLEVVRGTLGGLLTPFAVGSGRRCLFFLLGQLEAPLLVSLSRFALPLGRSKITPIASLPKAWLVAMSRSSLVVHGPVTPRVF